MMSVPIKYFLSLFLILTTGLSSVYGQQITRDQLLKLFYQANTAVKENNYQAAVDAYTEIIKRSPGLPDPYLQLGNLYAGRTDDAAALKKACICYLTYIKLKPESSQVPLLENKVKDLQGKIDALETSLASATKEDTIQQQEMVKKEKIVVVVPAVASDIQEPQKDTAAVDTDSLLVTDTIPSVSVPVRQIAAPDLRLSGRWVSEKLGENGREFWIVDVKSLQDKMEMSLADFSYVLKVGNWKHKVSSVAIAFSEKNDTLVFDFYSEKEKTADVDQKNILEDFGMIVSNLFDTGMERISEFTNRSNNSVGHDVDTLSMSVSDSSASVVDSVAVVNPKILYVSEFRLRYDGYKLSGFYLDQIVERTGKDERVLSAVSEPCEFIPAPVDYQGFTYNGLSESVKSSKRELRELLNQKMKESGSSTSALNDVACMYASGIGIRKNMKMAVAYFMEASVKNNLFGMLNMAQLYRDGLGVEKDVEKARELYHRAYNSGYTDAMVFCGDTYLEDAADTVSDYQNALACYQKAVLKRCPFAAYRLGWLYREGLGVEQNIEKAWEYYQQALVMQYPDAMTDVGIMYRDGNMTEKDYDKAYDYLLKAAQKGNARAMFELSQMYLQGIGVKPDFKTAKEWQYRFMEANDVVIEGFNTIKSKVKTILYPKSE